MARSEDLKTPLARLAFTQDLFKARAQEAGKPPKYGCTLLYAKTDNLDALRQLAVSVAVAEWGDKAVQWIKDGVIKNPFLDGDGPQAISKKSGERHPGFAGCTFIRVGSGEDFKPKIFDKKLNPITDPEACYSGCYGYPVLNAYTWENEKNGKGISFGISMIQVVKDGDRLGGTGGPDPTSHYETIADEGAAPAATKTGAGAAGLFA